MNRLLSATMQCAMRKDEGVALNSSQRISHEDEEPRENHTDLLEWRQRSPAVWLRMEACRAQPDVVGIELLLPA